MGLYLAVDAGGTKTGFLLADDTRELARVRTPTIKRMRTDAASATQALDLGLRSLTEQAGVPPAAITRACIGAAGWTVPLVADWLRTAFAARLHAEIILVGDVEIALDAAFHGGPGVLVLAGTGSNVAGRSPSGEVMTVGGWGPALADQGSGHRIGHEALRALFLALDERQPTTLERRILEHWHLPGIPDLVEAANRQPPPDFSRLAAIVVEAATAGDPVAQSVLHQEAHALAHLADVMLHRVYASTPPHPQTAPPPGIVASLEPPRLAFAGSILEHVTLVREEIVRTLRRGWPTLAITPGAVDPLLGALWRARLAPAVSHPQGTPTLP